MAAPCATSSPRASAVGADLVLAQPPDAEDRLVAGGAEEGNQIGRRFGSVRIDEPPQSRPQRRARRVDRRQLDREVRGNERAARLLVGRVERELSLSQLGLPGMANWQGHGRTLHVDDGAAASAS